MLRILPVIALVFSADSTLRADSPVEQAAEFFELKVRPVLAGTCFRCHGGEKTSGGLRVDTRKALLAGGEHGAAIIPGRPADSLLVRALRHEDDEVQMPPDAPLAKAAIDDLAAWIERGAVWPESAKSTSGEFAARGHWAFQPLRAVEPPVAAADGLSTPNRSVHRCSAARQATHTRAAGGPRRASAASLL